jgi:RND superfamily putative drug exporter
VARSSAWERADLRKGEALIASGNIAVQTNRQAYQAISQIPQGAESADAVADRASRFKKIAKAWEAGEEKIADGNDLVKRGNERIAEGEAEIAGGQRVIERGREKMQGAESRYTPAGS